MLSKIIYAGMITYPGTIRLPSKGQLLFLYNTNKPSPDTLTSCDSYL